MPPNLPPAYSARGRLARNLRATKKAATACYHRGFGLLQTTKMEMVLWARLELACLAALPPQDSVSTNFTTRAAFDGGGTEKCLVPRRRLELPRLAALVPETSASTNSATWAGVERRAFYGGKQGLPIAFLFFPIMLRQKPASRCPPADDQPRKVGGICAATTSPRAVATPSA